MSEPIKPALTEREWAHAQREDDRLDDIEYWSVAIRVPEERVAGIHRIAALALHGQPFGFTHNDLRLLRGLRECADAWADEMGATNDNTETDSLIARIAALLPLEGVTSWLA